MARKTRMSALNNDWEMFKIIKQNEDSEGNSEIKKKAVKALKKVIEEQLTTRQKQYIVLYYYNNVDMVQIAKQFGVNKSTVSRTINRARQKIYEYMKYYFI